MDLNQTNEQMEMFGYTDEGVQQARDATGGRRAQGAR